jgi:hypothetical protein
MNPIQIILSLHKHLYYIIENQIINLCKTDKTQATLFKTIIAYIVLQPLCQQFTIYIDFCGI